MQTSIFDGGFKNIHIKRPEKLVQFIRNSSKSGGYETVFLTHRPELKVQTIRLSITSPTLHILKIWIFLKMLGFLSIQSSVPDLELTDQDHEAASMP
jgi:hypothetical protein